MIKKIVFPRFYKQFGNRCRELRRERRLTQRAMKQFGFDRRHYQLIESGKPFHMNTAIRLSKAFNVPLSRLFECL